MNGNRIVLQVPMTHELKTAAEAVSVDYGFSSLQEIIRVLLRKLAKRELTMTVNDETIENVILSSAAKRRYEKMEKDFHIGKNVRITKSVDEFIKQLNS